VTAAGTSPAAAAIGVYAKSIILGGDFKPTTVVNTPVGWSIDYPKLGLGLLEPNDGAWAIPAARSMDDDVQERLVAEAAANGIPSRKWLNEALTPVRERIAKAKQNLDTDPNLDERQRSIEWFSLYREMDDPRDDLEEYAQSVQEWYKTVIRNLIRRHRHETFLARRLRLVLELSNNGRSPAEDIEVFLFFASELSVNDSIPSEYQFTTTVPVPPPNFVPERSDSAADVRPFSGHWYTLPPTKSAYLADAIPIFEIRSEDQIRGTKGYRAFGFSLQHGQSQKLSPIHVSFQYNPAANIIIGYKLHASNQPEDIVGEIEIQVSETQGS
jgi:hypothetical protein